MPRIFLVALTSLLFVQPGLPTAQAQTPADQTSLLEAVKAGDAPAVTVLLSQSVDVNRAEPDGTTPLHWAAHRNDVAIAEQLLEAGADVAVSNRYGVAPLMLAATSASVPIIRLLLDVGADPDTATPEGETALMTVARAGSADAIDLLASRGADVDAAESWRGQTALMWAAARGHASAARALIRAGADVHARSDGGFTPLLFTAREGHVAALGVLVDAGADPDETLPAIASRRSGVAAGTSALVLATYNAHYDLAAALLEAGADPNADEQGWTALHQVVWTRRPNLGRNPPFPVPSGDLDALDLVRRLIQYGADPNARQTAEPRDGNRNLLNRVGATPFLLAAKSGDPEMMRLLADHGADPSLTTEEGSTPMMAAAGVGIWKIGENPGTNEEALDAVRLAWDLGNPVGAVDVNGDTALHGAVHRGASNIVRFLAEKGANLDATNDIGWSALSVAQGVFYPNTFNRHPDVVDLLLELGADPQAGTRREMDLAPWERAAASGAEAR